MKIATLVFLASIVSFQASANEFYVAKAEVAITRTELQYGTKRLQTASGQVYFSQNGSACKMVLG